MGNNIKNLGCVNLRKTYSSKHPVSYNDTGKKKRIRRGREQFSKQVAIYRKFGERFEYKLFRLKIHHEKYPSHRADRIIPKLDISR
jgi:hypothetical protein